MAANDHALEPNTAENDPSAAQLVSQLAQDAQKRQELTQQAAQQETPDFVLGVEQSEALYTMPPRFLPLRHANYATLSQILDSKWSLTLDSERTALAPALSTVGREQLGTLTETEVMDHVLKSSRPEIAFRNGKYPLSDFDFVPIRGVQISFESVLVSVGGISRVAEAVAAEIVEAVWSSAGATRPWSAIEPYLQRRGYATRTKVDLGCPAEKLLSPTVLKFLDDEMIDGSKYATHMGHYLASAQGQPPVNTMSTYALDDLVIAFAWFDSNTGMSTRASLKVEVASFSEYRTGIVSVSSELPYDMHISCLEKLIQAL
jgi:hypothetical protein